MLKYLFSGLLVLSVSGCYFSFNSGICDQVVNKDQMDNRPSECRKYDEKKAEEAYFNHKKPVEVNITKEQDNLELEKSK